MTVSTTDSIQTFNGNGATVFPFGFRFLDATHLVVTRINIYGDNHTLVLGPDYTVTGAGAQNGGSVILTAPLLVGERLVVSRVVPIVQPTDLRNQGKYLAETHETVFDRLTMIDQQSESQLGRALRVPDSDPEPERLPGASSRANKVMGFDNEGNPIGVLPSSGSGTELAIDLANNADSAKGSAMIGHNGTTVRSKLIEHDTYISDLRSETSVGFARQNAYSTKGHLSVNGNLAAQNPWGLRCINVFGDSISFGANCTNIERDSYIGLLKKMLNIEFGQSNIGLLNIISGSGSPSDPFNQYFSTSGSQTGTWTSLTNAAAQHIPFGFALQSVVPGSTQNLKAPLSQRYMRVWYDGTVTGEIEVVINSVVVQTITTNSAGTGYDRGPAMELGNLVASNQGVVKFTLRCKSGTIRLTGLEFTNDTTGNSFRVNNFSRDGRAGRYVGQDVINKASAGCYAFIWALATNDITNYDEAAQAAYDQRIDWIITAASQNRTKVVFIDFLYNMPYSHGLRVSLRRGAASVPNAILIEADQVWTVSGAQYTEAERNQRGLSLGVHPEEIGHRLIAETLAQRLGLSCTSKKQAVLRDPMWKALDMSGSGFANNSTIPGRFTGYRISDHCIEIVVNLATVPAVLTTLGTIPVEDFPGFAGANFKSNPDPTGKNGLFTITSSGAVVYRPDPTITGAPTVCSLYATIPYHDATNWF
ncbi:MULTISPECIES: hypothetical protein [unclassified Pseudomonas]|uniref:hypothetical protein n=1 Tax=unclassified Pseudomonas TaxID=196821 RepID=UPI002097BCDB|nr:MULTISPECIES: hypothetical protein [unclassified Pseudomonas]MCO7503203.1 hypothetical protein [Pseudomonas sp. VE 267-6A]MCO7532481.1 hypothetical protein [Pseudomonas sp. 2]